MNQTYMIHPIAEIFPRMPGEEFVALKKDIRENGLLEPIWLHEGKVLDGRHRYYACQEVGATPSYREYTGSNPLGFVVSLNLKRRHLSESQRAMVAASLANMTVGGDRVSEHSANLQNGSVSQSQAAELLQVSPRSVATAAKIEREASPVVVEAVKAGSISLNLAAQVAELTKEEQQEVSEAPAEQIKEVARDVVKRAHVANNSGNNEWYTPAEYIVLAREVMGGIDTDPATSEIANKTVQATQIFTAENDGRAQQWKGRVWMNPPYAQPLIFDFAEAVSSKYESGEIEQACVLVNNGTETSWFQRLLKSASAVCFPRSRIKFVDPSGMPSGAPLQGQAVIYMGGNVDDFVAVFSEKGAVLLNA